MTAPHPAGALRVALDVGALLGPPTGIGVFTRRLVDGLATDPQLQVTAWAATWRGRHQIRTVVPPAMTVATRPMAARPLRQLWKRVDWPPLQWWTGPVDVAFGPTYVVPPTGAAAAVMSVHDLTVLRHPELCTRDTLEYPGLVQRAVRRGAWVHTDTEAVAAEVIEAFGVHPDRVRCVPLAADTLPDASAADGVALAGGDRFILALGTVEPRKDLPALVAAFDQVASADSDVRLVIAGPDGWGTPQLDAAMAACTHRDRIVRLGWVDDVGRSALLRAASVLAYPSRYEGFGIPPLEAMSVGTPVVATAVAAVAEVCGDAAVLVPVGDTAALADALADVLADGATAHRLRAGGPRRAAEFSWADTVGAITTLLSDAAGSSGH